MQPVIAATDLVLSREGRRILDGASLSVAEGELVAIEGPSGSGKSTLLRAIATLVALDSGTIAFRGQDVLSIAPPVYRTRVAYVPQQAPMLDGTVAWNVETGPRLRGERLEESVAARLVAQVGLPADFLARDARSLSGGERARVALARALANRPEVLLLDEPTAALDPESGARIVELVRSLGGVGIVFVTHIREHAASLGGTRYLCEAGKVRRL